MDAPSYRIVRAGVRDLFAVRRLERDAFPLDAYAWPEIFALLTFPGIVNFKALAPGGELVGHIAGDPRPAQAFSWIVTLAVDPRHRRRGIATRLLAACEDALCTPHIRLTVRASNTGAIALYKQRGYRRLFVWERYYKDGEDGIVMEKTKNEGTYKES